VSQAPLRAVMAGDEALIQFDLKEMLEEEAYEVVGEAADGEKAVGLASALKPDLVILDVKMPVLDGISAAERITAQQIALVLILTAFSQREDPARHVLKLETARGTHPGHPRRHPGTGGHHLPDIEKASRYEGLIVMCQLSMVTHVWHFLILAFPVGNGRQHDHIRLGPEPARRPTAIVRSHRASRTGFLGSAAWTLMRPLSDRNRERPMGPGTLCHRPATGWCRRHRRWPARPCRTAGRPAGPQENCSATCRSTR